MDLIKWDPVNDAWLDIGDTSKIVVDYNPLLDENNQYNDEPGLYEVSLLRRQEYLGIACKIFLNIELLPIQVVILEELWKRPFPLFIATRGFGKMISGLTPIRIKNGWKYMKDIVIGDKVYGGNGRLCTVINKTEHQKNLNMYRLTLRDGRTIECCEDHQWKVFDKNKNQYKKDDIIWSIVKTKDMVNNYYQKHIGKKNNGKEFRYALPINDPLLDEEEQSLPVHPYIVGILLGDGSITRKSVSIESADIEIIDKVKDLLPKGYTIRKRTRKKSKSNPYGIIRVNKQLPPFYYLLKQIGIFGCNSHTKFIPNQYKYNSYENKLELIRGLTDSDSYSGKSSIMYYTVSNQLSNDFLEVARSLGLACRHSIKQSWFNGKRYADCNVISIYTRLPIFSLSRKLNNYINHKKSKQGVSKYIKTYITNIEYIGKGDGYCISVDSPDNTYIIKDYIVTHNSFLLGVYALLRSLLFSDYKIVIAGAAFRQSKIIFSYMESIWNNAPILRSICSRSSGPHHDVDRWTFKINSSESLAIPVGCLIGDTLITGNNGIYNMKEYMGNKIWCRNKFKKVGFRYNKGFEDVIKVKTRAGFSYTGTYNHKMKIIRDGYEKWCRTDELKVGDDILIDTSERWFEPTFNCTPDQAYCLGAIIGDGGITDQYRIQFTTLDKEFLTYLNKEIGEFRPVKDKLHYFCCGKKRRQFFIFCI